MCFLSTLKSKSGGVFHLKNNCMHKILDVQCNNFEVLLFNTQTLLHYYMLFYRLSSYKIHNFTENLRAEIVTSPITEHEILINYI